VLICAIVYDVCCPTGLINWLDVIALWAALISLSCYHLCQSSLFVALLYEFGLSMSCPGLLPFVLACIGCCMCAFLLFQHLMLLLIGLLLI
jgi:hypothetical protein